MKKIFLYTAALATVAVSAIAPATSSVEAATVPIKEVIYTINGNHVSISFDYYTEAINVDVLNNPIPQYLELSDGKYYTFDDFTAASNISDSLDEAINLLSSNNLSASIDVTAGDINPTTGAVYPNTSSIPFKVTSID